MMEPEELVETVGTAYLREFVSSGQCELMFALKLELETIGVLDEEIRAVRQVSDTVGSLLQHIVNKISKIIKTMKEEQNCNENGELGVDINVALKNADSHKHLRSNMVLKNLIQSKLKNLEFSIFGRNYEVIINAPLVKVIKLPQVLYANFTVQPSKMYVLFAENNDCQYKWYKSQDKVNWTQVGNTYRYNIKDDDIDHFLKIVCVPSTKHLTGPPAEAVSESRVEKIGELPTCPFEQRHHFTTNKLEGNNFRVVSYNVLSNRYTETNEQFPYCSPRALAPDYRKQLISKELLGYQADIICLQEVDSALYTSYYKDIFKEKGYMSFYHRKGNKIPEGLACFFNLSRFKKIYDRQIIYSHEIKHNKLFSYLWKMVSKNASLKECFMKQMTSLQTTILKMREKNHYIVVANTHLFYRFDAEIIRILQANMATTFLNSLCKNFYKKGSRMNVIFCGDFNCVPDSTVFEYITTGKVSQSHELFKDLTHRVDLVHNFQFESACGKPKYTNYTKDFKDCLDYIYIEKDKIKVNKIIPFPSDEELGLHEGLPNNVFPSDHLAVVVDLELI